MDDLLDEIQFEEYCRFYPIDLEEWETMKLDYLQGYSEDDPYLLDAETAAQRVKGRIH